MKPPPFVYYRATSAADAIARIASEEEAVFLAGGQSLVPMLNLRLARPSTLIDLNDCAELAGVSVEGGVIRIGALTRHQAIATDADIARSNPLLARAAETIGYYPIRQRGTIGGSLAHADPAAQWPLMAALFDATIVLQSAEGQRELPASAFLLSVFATAREPGELLTSIRFPALRAGEGWGYAQLCKVSGDFAITSAAATLRRDTAGRIGAARLAVGAVCDTPTRIDCAPLIGMPLDAGGLESFAADAVAALPIEDGVGIAAEERRDLACTMIVRAFADAALRSGGAQP